MKLEQLEGRPIVNWAPGPVVDGRYRGYRLRGRWTDSGSVLVTAVDERYRAPWDGGARYPDLLPGIESLELQAAGYFDPDALNKGGGRGAYRTCIFQHGLDDAVAEIKRAIDAALAAPQRWPWFFTHMEREGDER